MEFGRLDTSSDTFFACHLDVQCNSRRPLPDKLGWHAAQGHNGTSTSGGKQWQPTLAVTHYCCWRS